ncbi:MAG: phenylalanyl-tRNA synthetase beta chain [Thermotogaceae bacterium]|nr:phenylalanyl-tRNA synthetase beta chain [Thermotogaceae bacterium]
MELSINLLKNYIDIPWDVKELQEKLIMSGTGVEKVYKPWEGMEKLKVGKIIEIIPHPNADNLVVCTVDVGKKVTLVTSDKSLQNGDFVIVAPEGTILKNGVEVKESEIRGIRSEGMLCSLEELGLEEKSTNVFRFSKEDFEKLKVGENVYKSLGLDDIVFELEITPNRPDCLSHIGIAREIRALSNSHLKKIDTEVPEDRLLNKDIRDFIEIKIEDPDACPRYTAAYIEGVKIGPSPLWLRRHLAAVGIRPINNVVDITNFVMLEMGHPIHAFDYDDIKSKKIVVRKSKKGEKILLLDGKEYELDGSELLITDGEEPLAMAGIMGGELSGIKENTENVLIEVAYFDPPTIRKAAKKHRISTDSSYRFERGVDPNDAEIVIKRVVSLIVKLAGGKVAKGIYDTYPKRINPKEVILRKQRVDSILGTPVEKGQIVKILQGLGFEVKESSDKSTLKVVVPTYRPDVEREIDLIEEIGRINGYSSIPSALPGFTLEHGGRNGYQRFRLNIVNFLNSLGYNETINFSMINPDYLKRWEFDETFPESSRVYIENPISKEISLMRPSLIFGLMDTLSYNFTRQNRDIKLFEIGHVFEKNESSETKVREIEKLAFISSGRDEKDNYFYKSNVNFYTFKGDFESLLQQLNLIDKIEFKAFELPGFHPSRCAKVFCNDVEIGFVGQVLPEVAERFDVKSDVFAAEVNIQRLFEFYEEIPVYKNIPVYPYIRRDVSLLIPKDFESQKIMKFIRNFANDLIEKVDVIDYYIGKGIPEGYFSATFSIYFRSKEKTLTDDEVNEIFEEILDDIQKHFGVKVRT